jgi:hypothetical protein
MLDPTNYAQRGELAIGSIAQTETSAGESCFCHGVLEGYQHVL